MKSSSLHRGLSCRLSGLAIVCAALGATLTTSQVARAQEDIEIEVQPPAPRVEVVGAAPSPHHFWIHGYYGWVRGAHVWYPGRWEVRRPGWSWSESRWAPVGRRWHFYPGHWYR